ncbi:hypothetical protein [Fischerella thermalis]|nr:hypothetical protein [Fischerella thermalis]
MAEQIFGSQGLRNYEWFSIPNSKWLCDHFTLKLNDNFEELVRTGDRP